MSSPQHDPWIVQAFQSATAEFKSKLKSPERFDFSRYDSVNHVYEETTKIQAEQAKSGWLCALNRLSPYLKCLTQYESVIEVFVQANQELLPLIWGPIKFILHLASRLTKTFERIVEVLRDVGLVLPDFHAWAAVFATNIRVTRVLCLFYQDILDLHVTLLNFFARKKWEIFFEAFWPQTAETIGQLQDNIRKHRTLITEEVTLEHIIQALSARLQVNSENERIRELQELQLFQSLQTELKVTLYDAELEAATRTCATIAGEWIQSNVDFRKWSCPNDHENATFWLQGIPGAGKTVLSGKIIQRLRQSGQTVLFGFLTYRDPEQSSAIKVFQSLVFQLLYEYPSYRPVVHEAYTSHYRDLIGNVESTKTLFLNLVQELETIYVIIDGLDEAPESSRSLFVKSLLSIVEACNNVKLLISSRVERVFAKEFDKIALRLRVDHHNAADIVNYLATEELAVANQLRELGAEDNMLAEVKAATEFIARNAKGMMLYAKLLVETVKSLDSPLEIRNELQHLPEGLDEAYGRILERIKTSPHKTKMAAQKILQWLGCAPPSYPLREQEILQALAIEKESQTFRIGRRALRDIRQTCGPIIEIEDGVVQFVHFTAKEYIFRARDGFLDITQSNHDVASTVLTYLNFSSFDKIFSVSPVENDISRQIISNDFILFQYSATEWLTHVRTSSNDSRQSGIEDIVNILSIFLERRRNHEFETQENSTLHTKYQALQRPPLLALLSEAENFAYRYRNGLLDQEASEGPWVYEDPTLVSMALMRFRRCLETLLCNTEPHRPDCICPELESFYGPGLFRCDRVICPHYRTGFSTSSKRDSHMQVHMRPFKCSELDCLFASLGLRTEKELRLHVNTHHNETANENSSRVITIPQHIPALTLKDIVDDAIENDDFDTAQQLLLQSKDQNWLASDLFKKAAKHGSEPMLQWIIDFANQGIFAKDKIDFVSSMHAAVSYDNIPAIRLCIKQGVDIDGRVNSRSVLEQAIRWGSPQCIDTLLQHGAGKKLVFRNPSSFRQPSSLEFLNARDTKLKKYFEMFERHHLSRDLCQWLFISGIERNSVPIAHFFLCRGADINKPCIDITPAGPTTSSQITFKTSKPLQLAVKKNSVEMVKFLLQNGAENDEAMREFSCVKSFEARLGMSWEDFVQQHQNHSDTREDT